jgi:nitrite reductase/ring-hydroxylating ferredoxin subunit
MVLPVALQRVAKESDVPTDRGLCVRIADLEIGLFRVGDQIHAMENRCPHRDFPLSEGDLSEAVVTCPAHGWSFDVRTGFRPDDDDGWPIPCFEVRVEAGDVWIDVERAINLPGSRRKRRPE